MNRGHILAIFQRKSLPTFLDDTEIESDEQVNVESFPLYCSSAHKRERGIPDFS